MARKKKIIEEEIKEHITKLENLQTILEESAKEEELILTVTKKKIDEICDKAGVKCCIILNTETVLAIVKQKLITGEDLTINYNLYIKE